MSLQEMRAKIQATVWQAVAQSGVNVAAIPQAEADKLVAAITNNVLKEMDSLLSSASGQVSSTVTPTSDDDDDVERVLWEGRPFLSLIVSYQITNQRVRIVEGMLSKQRHDIELVRIQDIDHKQNLTERAFSIGDVFIRGHDSTNPEIVLYNISDPAEVHEVLRRAVLKARKQNKVILREEM